VPCITYSCTIMDKFTALEPVRLHDPPKPPPTAATKGLLSKPSSQPAVPKSFIGVLPTEVHLLILSYLPIPYFPAYSQCCKATSRLVRDEDIWSTRWNALGIDKHGLQPVVDALEEKASGVYASAAPPTLAVDDEFGDFAAPDAMLFNKFALAAAEAVTLSGKPSSVSLFKRAHTVLKPVCKILSSSSPHEVLKDLEKFLPSKLLRQKAMTLHLMSFYLSPYVQPLQEWETLASSLKMAIDRFESTLLASFDLADSQANEAGMRETAESSWEVWDGTGDWEMGKVWTEKREIFYETGKWDPMANFTCVFLFFFEACDA
jgi:recyclin-1